MISAELGRSEPGGTEQALREAWEDAREAADEEDSILLLEEVDCLGAGAAARRVGGQLQTLLGESKSKGKVLLVATTAVPELLPAALRRPGRLSSEESVTGIYPQIICSLYVRSVSLPRARMKDSQC